MSTLPSSIAILSSGVSALAVYMYYWYVDAGGMSALVVSVMGKSLSEAGLDVCKTGSTLTRIEQVRA